MPGTHAILGASSAERWLNCTPSAQLTADMPDTGSEYAAEGTLAHKIGELKLRKRFVTGIGPKKFNAEMDKLKADPLYSPEMDSTTDEYLDAVNEIAMALPEHPYVALEQQVDFSDWVPGGFGTADCIVIGGGILHVIDYKHGKGVPVPAESNVQLMLYCLGAYVRYGLFYDVKTIRWTIVQPRNGGVSEAQELTVEALLAWAENYVRPRAKMAAEGTGEYSPGEWCRFCKVKATCRARSDYNLSLEDFHAAPPALLFPEELGAILFRATDLKKWLSDIEVFVLSALLDGEEIPGWKAVEGRAVRTWTDQDAAFKAAMEAGTPEEMLYERRPVTLAALEKIMGKKNFQVLNAFVHIPPGKPTLAPETDKRPPVTTRPTAEQDFTAEQ
jgi:hypothetical protein